MPSETKKISIIIPADLHRELKHCVLNSDTTITALIQGLIVDYLAKDDASPSIKASKDHV